MFTIHDPRFHLNEREHEIFELRDSLATASCFGTHQEEVPKWLKRLEELKNRRFTDIPTSRPHSAEKSRRIEDREYVFGEPQWIHPKWREFMKKA